MHVFAIVVRVSSAPGSLKTAFLRAESIDSEVRKGPSSALACVARRLYVGAAVLDRALVRREVVVQARLRVLQVVEHDEDVEDAEQLDAAAPRTGSPTPPPSSSPRRGRRGGVEHFETTSSRKYISCFTRSMCRWHHHSTPRTSPSCAPRRPSRPAAARARARRTSGIETRSAPRFSIASSSDIRSRTSANCSRRRARVPARAGAGS